MKNELKINGFSAVAEDEMTDVNGGGVTAAVYALGFAMGMSPLGAICVCTGAVAIGVGLAVMSIRSNSSSSNSGSGNSNGGSSYGSGIAA